MSDTLSIQAEAVNSHCVIVSLSGQFLAGDSQTVKDLFKRVVEGDVANVVVDMADVPFIDSGGLSALVSGLKITRGAGGNMVLSGVQPQTLTVLSLTMLDKVFAIYPDRQTALDSLPHIAAG